MPDEPIIEGKPVTWYVDTISTKDIPFWQWDEIDAGDWHLINVVKGEFRRGVEDGRAAQQAAKA